ncbi:hypothetical protein [Bythopirellula goksoeyrii]|uniref:Uncharacterized protein n=1 Tax=Bythopirellula goksoeyrii TaxID=1400387 RepID=A0A5B9QFB6_9BACT|nr:hypothetical protein [Bythopirellula goksoeyrii]QEG37708.1 hypothetical protein Pr1d_50540 [Bythopirellula goksoeyrii]
MAERKPLTAGLTVVPPGADADAVRAFVTQERTPPPATEAKLPATETKKVTQAVEEEPEAEEVRTPKKRKGKKAAFPVGLIPVTVRLKPEIAAALKRASLERQLAGEEIYTQQDLVEEALEPWLKGEGHL